MPADVEVVPFVADRPRDAADVGGVGFQHRDRDVVFGKLIGGGQPGGACADDGYGGRLHDGSASLRRLRVAQP